MNLDCYWRSLAPLSPGVGVAVGWVAQSFYVMRGASTENCKKILKLPVVIHPGLEGWQVQRCFERQDHIDTQQSGSWKK